MSRSVVSVALVFVISLMVLGLAGCQQPTRDTNLNATATASPAKEAVDTVAIQTEVLNVEREWFRAGETYDVEAIKRIVADDAVLVYPDGTLGTKADEVRIAETKAITGGGWEMTDPKVTVLSADAAYITGRSSNKNGKYKEPNMTKAIDISGEYRFLDVYVRRNGRWQVVASQATKVAVQMLAASPTATAAASATAAPPSPPRPSPTATKTP